MTTKHTPGPWMAIKTDEGDLVKFGIICAKDPIGSPANDICAIWDRGGKEKTLANAQLITAAPELLDAIIELARTATTLQIAYETQFGTNSFTFNVHNAGAKARAAIAKATGSQS
ncbi:MAG: hypothetical protein ACKO0Z_09890 [Betaproteobacteria bacterium]